MNIFITGGTGLVGRALVPHLLYQNHKLTLLTRSPEKNAKAISQKPPNNRGKFSSGVFQFQSI